MKPVIIIPAYQPGEELIALVDGLVQDPSQCIIVVDDGSTGASRGTFNAIASHSNQVTVLHHAVNLGKGQALKTAFNHFLVHHAKDCIGVVTADADGQHALEDILHVSESLRAFPQSLCLGSRKLERDVPLRSFLGNRLTVMVFRMVTGITLRDTQTGLRGIPTDALYDLLRSVESGYDFELDMLIRAARSRRTFYEIPIRTIYKADNEGSHFNYLSDSLKIYFVFLRFSILSLASAAIDYLIFALVFLYSGSIFLSIAAARLGAGTLQFTLGKSWVFKSESGAASEIIKYCLLVAVLMTLSYGLIVPMITYLEMSPYIAKIVAEGTIFLLSFAAQNVLVYSTRSHKDTRTHWDAYYNAPFKASSISRRFTENRLHQLVDAFSTTPISRICELGGGNSWFFSRLRAKYPGASYAIIDNNQRGLDLFQERHGDDEAVEVINDDVIDPRCTAARADLVMSVGLIEHFGRQDTARAIQTHFACAKPGALVIISFPTPTWLYACARFVAEMAGAWKFPDERPLSLDEVTAEVRKHGEILDVSINWPVVFTQGIVVARAFSE